MDKSTRFQPLPLAWVSIPPNASDANMSFFWIAKTCATGSEKRTARPREGTGVRRNIGPPSPEKNKVGNPDVPPKYRICFRAKTQLCFFRGGPGGILYFGGHPSPMEASSRNSLLDSRSFAQDSS